MERGGVDVYISFKYDLTSSVGGASERADTQTTSAMV